MTQPALAPVVSLDHLVLTCTSIPSTIHFYTHYLGMTHSTFTSPSSPSTTRHTLTFGSHKINLHQKGAEFEPKASVALPGTADLCFIVEEETVLEEVVQGWKREGVEVLEGGGVVERSGARGRLRSVYVRDPDGNLVE